MNKLMKFLYYVLLIILNLLIQIKLGTYLYLASVLTDKHYLFVSSMIVLNLLLFVIHALILFGLYKWRCKLYKNKKWFYKDKNVEPTEKTYKPTFFILAICTIIFIFVLPKMIIL